MARRGDDEGTIFWACGEILFRIDSIFSSLKYAVF